MNELTSRLHEVEVELGRRWPESKLDPTLERVAALMARLGDPQHAAPAIHVTGTNGKTTTARIIDELLRAAGFRVGRYTSPHLTSVRERIVIDGQPIDAAAFVAIYDHVLPAVEEVDRAGSVPLSFFEVITAMAFVAFARLGVNAAVVEVGMGGTWDATNVVDGRVAAVTPIALDHTEYLGPDEIAIAREKAGIIKPGATAVIADQIPAVERVLRTRAQHVGALLRTSSDVVRLIRRTPYCGGQKLHLRSSTGDLPDLHLPLRGAYQAQNACTALAAVEAFLAGEGDGLDAVAVRRAFAAARAPGRLELVRHDPPVLVDASHNPAGMCAGVAALTESPLYPDSGQDCGTGATRVAVVLAVLSDKDVRTMLEAVSEVATLVVVSHNSSPRTLAVADLEACAREILGDDRVRTCSELGSAIDWAINWAATDAADPTDRPAVLVTGSVVTAGDARAMLVAD